MPTDLTATLSTSPDQAALRRDAARIGAAIWVLLAVAALTVAQAWLGDWYVAKALAVFGLGCGLAWSALPAHRPHARFGLANAVTLLRLALIALLAAALGEAAAHTPAGAAALVTLATVAALLDALDGPLARRSGAASPFGARFDMETDALLIGVLCLLALQLDRAGAWVLAAGLARYAFVLAAWRWRWLAAPLPPRTRRKAVCVLQIATLILCLAPWIDAATAHWIAGAGLVALLGSFAADIRWLARRHRQLNLEPHP